MNRTRLLVAALTAALAGSAMAAPPTTAVGAQHRPMMRVDTNSDGVIDRAEAATHPRMAAMFDSLDKNKDGRLEASERPSWKGKRGQHGGKHAGMGHGGRHGAALDTDGDGRISRAEAAVQPRFAARFDQADGNRDGFLVRSELRAWSEKHRAERMARHRGMFDAKFAKADINGDGKLSRVEADSGMPHLGKAFAFHDDNRDGFLSRAELQPASRR